MIGPGISVENRTLGPALVRALAELEQPKARKLQAASLTAGPDCVSIGL